MKAIVGLCALTAVLLVPQGASKPPVSAAAEGFGADTPGGRGGREIRVTTLADAGPGSFRAAVAASGPRTVVFSVAGLITLASPVVIDPLVRFGRPAVLGVATERIWELFDAGESVERIAEGYEMAEDLVQAAIAFEEQLRSLAAQPA